MKDIDLITLVRKIKKNDTKAFEAILNNYYSRVQCFCQNMMCSDAECDEVVEKVFSSLWEQRKKINNSESLPILLFEILKHEAFEKLKNDIIRQTDSYAEVFFMQKSEELYIELNNSFAL